MQRICDELSYCWLLASRAEDVVQGPSVDDPDLRRSCESVGLEWPDFQSEIERDGRAVHPWGWSESVAQLSGSETANAHNVNSVAVKATNARRFSIELERELGVGVGAQVVTELGELSEVVSSLWTDAGVLLRENWSCSARGMRRILDPLIGRKDRSWVANRLDRDAAIVVEPLLEIEHESSRHFELRDGGAVEFVGEVLQITDQLGIYRGGIASSRAKSTDDRGGSGPAAKSAATTAAVRVAQAGYCGPLGIDETAFIRSGSGRQVRPIQDINARWTMGRLLLDCQRRLGLEDHCLAWVHVRWAPDRSPSDQWQGMCDRVPDPVRIARLSPFSLCDQPARIGSVLLIAQDSQTLQPVIDVLL